MTKENELLPCRCGKIPRVMKYEKPKPFVSISGMTRQVEPFVSIQCNRHDGVLLNVSVSGNTIDEALTKAITAWNKRHTPQSVDVEGLKRDYGAGFDMSVYRSSNNEGWNACLDYISKHYDIVKKSEEAHDKNR